MFNEKLVISGTFVCLMAVGIAASMASLNAVAGTCNESDSGKRILWGDLHVHSGYSLDAWGYGTVNSPAEAYAFARGAPATLADGQTVQLERPLDFMAVTDHAEWFNLMYLCTDPEALDDEYCTVLTEKNNPVEGREVFLNYVVPTITKAQPQQTALCQENPQACRRAHLAQWHRVQQQANAANDPCEFTSFVAFEWSATPDFSHNHRNVVFASEKVTADAIDYLRYPTPRALWRELDRQCRAEDDCDVIAIPHNTNMGDGRSFDVETEGPDALALRARYERLVEIHQQKGNSECLSPFGATDEDCRFERYLTHRSQPKSADEFTREEWDRMRGGYVRQLLLRGLRAYTRSGQERLNPLQLGIIGSTDNHTAAGGFVDEELWPGTVFGIGDLDRAMSRVAFNPGGLVAVWAQENTRESVFAALKRREVYATSGPRIGVKVEAADSALSCAENGEQTHASAVGMGSELVTDSSAYFKIHAQADRTPLVAIDIVRGRATQDSVEEEVVRVWDRAQGARDACVVWQDAGFDKGAPAFWYARILQGATPRWSAYRCRREGRCDEFPEANTWIQERAWTSPIWYLP